ncbi:MAG: UDP-N-acetylmuramate--L-alanine ligase [Myxococcales bacterium]|nr:MAG: UDP-N-acetylmuramate--L-alanine ligase [Myxococcales bacterium]
MSGIAEVLLGHGFEVSGSDLKRSDVTDHLQAKGARICLGHKAAHVQDADVLVFSSAVSRDNPELVEARDKAVPVIPRAEMLAELMRLKDGIAIAGSHGKTTTTSLVATVLHHAKLDPTVIIGGRLNALGSGGARGAGNIMVAEADESDGSFLHLSPAVAVITNIDPEHLDYYKTQEALMQAFVRFANKVPFYGTVVACLDHPGVQSLLPAIEKRLCTYGLSAQADYRGRNPRFEGLSTRFELIRRGESLGEIEVNMPGIHNVLNALAVIAVADILDVPLDTVREALKNFAGVQRRFTVLGEVSSVMVVDDYGHHPAEIMATLEAAQRAFSRRIVTVFQPHRYTRTRDLFEELAQAFNRAHVLVITDIYPAGEGPIEGITATALADAVKAHGHRKVIYAPKDGSLADTVLAQLKPADLLITLGAGDITKLAPELLGRLDKWVWQAQSKS